MSEEPPNESERRGSWVGTGVPGPGRPKGYRLKRNRILDEVLETDSKAIAEKLSELAKGGNMTAISVCADYLWTKRKVQSDPLEMPELVGKTLAEQGTAVIEALAKGELTPDEATAAMTVISSHARIIEVDELARRLDELEKRHGATS